MSNMRHQLRVGNSYFIQGVTMYYTGRLIGFSETELILEDAAWVAEVGRFNKALETGILEEVEPFPDGVVVHIQRSAVLTVCDWNHDLPRTVRPS